jgi:hypothetical protein
MPDAAEVSGREDRREVRQPGFSRTYPIVAGLRQVQETTKREDDASRS